jgi:hypothetical protein
MTQSLLQAVAARAVRAVPVVGGALAAARRLLKLRAVEQLTVKVLQTMKRTTMRMMMKISALTRQAACSTWMAGCLKGWLMLAGRIFPMQILWGMAPCVV